MKSVEEAMQDSKFQFESAKIISGEQEGSFSWITVNYLDGDFSKVNETRVIFSHFMFV